MCLCGHVWNIVEITESYIGKKHEGVADLPCPKCDTVTSLHIFNESQFIWSLISKLWERGWSEKEIGQEVATLFVFVRNPQSSEQKVNEK